MMWTFTDFSIAIVDFSNILTYNIKIYEEIIGNLNKDKEFKND
jgi:hypothetical protein